MPDLLIIDDDPDSAEALSMVMRSQGHDVRVGYDGEEGLRLAHAQIPDLALLDVEMPILSGPGMALQMFLHDMGLENVPVILLSGAPNLAEVAKEVGTPYFLPKPYRIAHVARLVERALTERVAPHPAPPPAP